MKAISFFLTCLVLTLTSCGKFKDSGTSVWGGFLWLVPLLTFGGAAWFGYKAYKAWQSGSKQQMPDHTTVYSTEKTPLYKIPYTYYSAVCLIATIVIIIAVNASK